MLTSAHCQSHTCLDTSDPYQDASIFHTSPYQHHRQKENIEFDAFFSDIFDEAMSEGKLHLQLSSEGHALKSPPPYDNDADDLSTLESVSALDCWNPPSPSMAPDAEESK